MAPVPHARFITLEGLDGAGKSTHASWLREAMTARGHRVVATREPGGTPVGEKLRAMLLSEPMSHDTEALLMFAARREHLAQVIRPALARGEWVLCDRFSDATYAYQGGGHGVDRLRIAQLEQWVHGDCMPGITLLFDVTPEVSRMRLDRSGRDGRVPDKFEREREAFFGRVREVYLQRARAEPERFRLIDAARDIDAVRADLMSIVDRLA